MSFNVYTQDDVNKKILEVLPAVLGSEAQLGPFNGYRDDEHNIYLTKKREFMEGVARYKEANRAALCSNKSRFDSDCNELFRYGGECLCEAEERYERCYDAMSSDGLVLRKRTSRYIHDDTFGKLEMYTVEPWSVRYLRLCKFINAARTVILKNRLVRNLSILKTLDEDIVEQLESQQRPIENISYSELFAPFID